MPKLSILLPTYNGEPFLTEQIESILGQSDGDFELIAIDDGSSDHTVDLLSDLSARDSRILMLPSAGNLGQNARLVELLGRARGEYVAIADQDDRWELDRNARLFAAMGDGQLVFGRSDLMDAEGKSLGKSILGHFGVEYHSDDRLTALTQPMFSAHAMIIRRDRMGIDAFFNPLPFDWLMALDAAFGSGLAYCHDAVVHHRIHGLNQCNNLELSNQPKKVRRGELNNMLLFRTPARIRLHGVFDFLSRSVRIGTDARKKFDRVAKSCYTVWFSESRSLRSFEALNKEIITELTPLAGSSDDLDRFVRYIDLLTKPMISAPVMNEVRRRYALLRAS